MSRRMTSNKSKKRVQEDKYQQEINTILHDFCGHCEEPATGPDRCDKCEYGIRLNDLYWINHMLDSEYGA